MKNISFKQGVSARGFGLIELMVALTIGLVLILALSYFFLGSRQSSRVHDDSSRMQEGARNALDLMGKAIRQAGYRSSYAVPLPTGTVVLGGTVGTTGASDSVTVSYQAQAGAGENDCAGTARAEGTVLVFNFQVNSSRQLTCDPGGGVGPVVLADNVEKMLVVYGTDLNRNGVVTSYDSLPADFGKVVVVKVTLTMRGDNANAATGGDGYLRQTYSASYTVRNQAF